MTAWHGSTDAQKQTWSVRDTQSLPTVVIIPEPETDLAGRLSGNQPGP